MIDEFMTVCQTVTSYTKSDILAVCVCSYIFGVFCAGLGDLIIKGIKKLIDKRSKNNDKLKSKY